LPALKDKVGHTYDPLIRGGRHISLHQLGRCCQRVQWRALRGFSSVSPVTASIPSYCRTILKSTVPSP